MRLCLLRVSMYVLCEAKAASPPLGSLMIDALSAGISYNPRPCCGQLFARLKQHSGKTIVELDCQKAPRGASQEEGQLGELVNCKALGPSPLYTGLDPAGIRSGYPPQIGYPGSLVRLSATMPEM